MQLVVVREASGKAEYVTTAQVAERLGITERAAQLLCKAGHLPARRLPGTRAWRIDARAFEALLAGFAV